ncbi:type II toxin-antitoxin system prevent-host-death family antitoxin [Kribbella sp. NPDC006257]|uniref:type II toxin-antitoxin system Phd/YefM family antitoxin n=1 Tax=Kribbella sp. NPDC006257 TaxID=3156738 RepID=UPI0033A9EFF6
MDIGIRELRDGLSRHLAEVRSGRTITVTDHGKPIARIVPIDQPSALERLIAEGVVRPPLSRKRKAPVPAPADGPNAADGPISELVADQRR